MVEYTTIAAAAPPPTTTTTTTTTVNSRKTPIICVYKIFRRWFAYAYNADCVFVASKGVYTKNAFIFNFLYSQIKIGVLLNPLRVLILLTPCVPP